MRLLGQFTLPKNCLCIKKKQQLWYACGFMLLHLNIGLYVFSGLDVSILSEETVYRSLYNLKSSKKKKSCNLVIKHLAWKRLQRIFDSVKVVGHQGDQVILRFLTYIFIIYCIFINMY